MNIKPVMVTLMVLLTTVATSPLQAQNAGFRIGLAQPQSPTATPASPNPVQGMTTPPVQGMTTPPIQGMTTPPILPMGGVVAPRQNPLPAQFPYGVGANTVSVLPPGETIFVPAGTLVIENSPGMQQGNLLTAPEDSETTDSILNSTLSSTPGPSTGTRSESAPDQRPNPGSNREGNANGNSASPQDVSRLEIGTPRDKVIEKYGNPIAYTMNLNGQTLYFNNGVVVFVKDGVVATPGK